MQFTPAYIKPFTENSRKSSGNKVCSRLRWANRKRAIADKPQLCPVYRIELGGQVPHIRIPLVWEQCQYRTIPVAAVVQVKTAVRVVSSD